jgi:hypothetical protein
MFLPERPRTSEAIGVSLLHSPFERINLTALPRRRNISTSPEPPLHLLLGSDAFDYVQKELEALRGEFSNLESLTRSTNFEQTA